ncbi:hypothetical protein BC936DRAFT_141243 [Jimgerdemannia flammicorona]|uniref:SET domain-containing protein n=1 Tax=Jimgerdemannia flammicorona TaxID=994334 RepID=A0A433DMK7_9FUNG|nr:hypothetical protein BC936DRAFT_141243 [Jimgerdemannia flammicorona]
MLIRAVRDLSEGEEVCVTYIEVLDMYEVRIKKLKKRNFECQCPLCDFERAQPEERHRRAELFDEFTQPEIQIGNVGMMPRLRRVSRDALEHWCDNIHPLAPGQKEYYRQRCGHKNGTARVAATPTSYRPRPHALCICRTEHLPWPDQSGGPGATRGIRVPTVLCRDQSHPRRPRITDRKDVREAQEVRRSGAVEEGGQKRVSETFWRG